jgi:hypothetical protein
MRIPRRFVPVLVLLAGLAAAPAAAAATTVAVIGDTPYGDAEIAALPGDVQAINADPAVRLVLHLGDIKNGSSPCSDSYFAQIRSDFDAFADPLVYTPGDNEWTDCHRANNGGYVPTERLAELRDVFFAAPGTTLGQRARAVRYQRGYPENVRFRVDGVVFGAVHIVGSNDDRAPWFGDRRDAAGNPVPETAQERTLREQEVAARQAANLAWIDRIFAAARRRHAPAVALGLQADMWDATASDLSGFDAYKARLEARARAFRRPVLLLNGDSHLFQADHPLAGAPNLARITVNGSTNCPHEYLRLTIERATRAVFSHERVPLPSSAQLCPDAPAPPAGPQPALVARALLPGDTTAAAPFAGAPNTEPVPAPGATQPVGGFSALLDAPGRDTYWAMPDNGFGNKANSRSFLLRLYRVHADWRTAQGGSGTVRVLDWIGLRDPDRKIPFRLVTEGTAERLLTGGDFDVESVRMDRRGELWFGDEFGPFLLHTDVTGKVLEAPIPLPGVKSPDYPADFPAQVDGPANLASSNGFEGMAISRDGRTLYPALEGPVSGDDPQTRRVHEFDIAAREYTVRSWTYRVDDPSYLLSDFSALDDHRFVTLERDNFQGTAARHKQAYVVELARAGTGAEKRTVADLLDLADPGLISLPGRPGDIGLGNPFAMPYVTIEAVLPLRGGRLAIVNDTNFGSTGRNPALPDDSDFIVVGVPGLRGS